MNNSDIKLENSGVRIDGNYLFVGGESLELNSSEHHAEDSSGRFRRALVHSPDDTLIVNYADDYRGVLINGNRSEGVKVNGDIDVIGNISVADMLETERLVVTRHLGINEKGKLYVGGNAEFNKTPTVPDLNITALGKSVTLRPGGSFGRPTIGGPSFTQPVSLAEIIQGLRTQIETLEQRVKSLEERR